MKITKQQLKQIIKEEISTLTEGGQWPGSGDSLRALAPLADAIANDLGVDLYEDNIAERLAEIVLKEFYEGSDGTKPIKNPDTAHTIGMETNHHTMQDINMKITKSQLKQIIKEEVAEELNEFMDDPDPGDQAEYEDLIAQIGVSEDFNRLLTLNNRLDIEPEEMLRMLFDMSHNEPEIEKEYDPADSPFTRPKAARYR